MHTMLPDDLWLILSAAIVVDAAAGDPGVLYRHIPHPVQVFGYLISGCERLAFANRPLRPSTAFVAGTMTVMVTVGLTGTTFWWLQDTLVGLANPTASAFATLAMVLLASTLLAGRGLHDYVLQVAGALERGIESGRSQVGEIVGRDPDSLDEAGVARAAIESGAENFVDGFVAPAFWFAVLGLPGIAAYKAINTLDSMIGHHNARYEYFGKCAARLDDLATLIPARLGGLCIAIGALLLPGADARRSLAAMFASASAHRSPNAGWSEAAMAGALNLALGGPRSYDGVPVADAWMGSGRTRLDAYDIHRSVRLYRRAWLVAAVACIALGAVLHGT